MVQQRLDGQFIDSQVLPAARGGSSQVMDPPAAYAGPLIEPRLGKRKALKRAADLAGKDEVPRLAGADQGEGLRRQPQLPRPIRLVVAALAPDAVQNVPIPQ